VSTSGNAKAVVIALLASLCAIGPRATADVGWRGSTTGLVGSAQYSDGEFIWTDYAFDDYGAATTPPVDDYENLIYPGDTAARSSRGGYQYPDGYGANGADIVEVRARDDGDVVRFLVRLNAMQRPDAVAVSIAIDAYPDLRAMAMQWPHGAGVRTSGADAVITAHGDDADLYPAGTALVAHADADENRIEVSLPHDALPASGVWRLWAGAGLWDAVRGEYAAVLPGVTGTQPGLGSQLVEARLFDVAFNRPEPTEGFQAYWNDVVQAETLATGDLTALSGELDFAKLGKEIHPRPATGAFNHYTYRSSIDMGEGLIAEPRRAHDNFVYLSRYQPYAVYVPATLADPAPVLYLMHFRGGNHNGFTVGSQAYTRIAEELGALIVQPHSRGEYRMCEADAEVDFDDVRAELARNFSVDDDRVFLAGMSMGGFCTWRLGLAHPDLFAAAIVYAGWPQAAWPSYGTVVAGDVPAPPYDMTDYAENARNLPFLVIHGTNDEILPVNDSIAMLETLDNLGYEYRFQLYPGAHHDSQFPARTTSSAIDWLRGRRRDTNPVHVTYRTWPQQLAHADPSVGNADYGLAYDRAYWTSGIRPAETSRPSHVNATTSGLGRGEAQTGEYIGLLSDEAGTFYVEGRSPGWVPIRVREDSFVIDLSNVSEVTLDLARMGLDDEATYTITSDVPVIVHMRAPDGTVHDVAR
jgi:dienelactone hydrolase